MPVYQCPFSSLGMITVAIINQSLITIAFVFAFISDSDAKCQWNSFLLPAEITVKEQGSFW